MTNGASLMRFQRIVPDGVAVCKIHSQALLPGSFVSRHLKICCQIRVLPQNFAGMKDKYLLNKSWQAIKIMQ